MADGFEFRAVPKQPAIFIAATCTRDDIGRVIMEIFPEVHRALERFGVTPAGAPFCRYVTVSGRGIDIEAGMPVDKPAASADLRFLTGTLGGCTAAYGRHRGPYAGLGASYAALEHWIIERGRIPGAGHWTAYVNDPSTHPDPEDWLAELYWPV